jgi:hypothetical protein
VGLDLAKSPALVTAECGTGVKLSVTGSVIAPFASVGSMLIKDKLAFTSSQGKQAPERFEEGPLDTLTSKLGAGAAQQAGLTSLWKLINTAPLEIKAAVK